MPNQQDFSYNLTQILDRNLIQVDLKPVYEFLKSKIVLVTGGAGSIGSEIVRELLKSDVQKIILIDHSETALHQLSLELEHYKNRCHYFLGDIKNELFLDKILSESIAIFGRKVLYNKFSNGIKVFNPSFPPFS